MPKAFVDTNVFFYAIDGSDSHKQTKAIALLTTLAQKGTGRISTQVAMELAANLVKKLGLSPEHARKLLVGLDDFVLIPTGSATVSRALELMDQASLSFWDATIVAAAASGGCDTLYTEDLSDGQVIAGVRILNPF
ncbi:PIN domain-containing protein [bacterium]|nr:MAG: PIN domain-containing protein [bacterium]